MKYFLFLLVSITYITIGYSQINNTETGPVFDKFGGVYAIDEADLILDAEINYKVIFDIYTDEKKASVMNPLINTIARFMNMHAQNGLPEDQMDIVVVLHGTATRNALNKKAFKKEFKAKHPNAELITELVQKNVKVYVCGQSMKSKGYDSKDISADVKISLSALTALVKYQYEGYQLINFN